MRLNAHHYLLSVVAIFCVFAGLYAYLLNSVIGSTLQTDEYWTRAIYDYKQHAAKQSEAPKVIVLSGSNGMFGVDSSLLGQTLGRKAVNLAIHGDLDISFLYQQLSETMAPGDWVLMPLEYEYYTESKDLSLEFVSSMVAWGEDIYLKHLSLPEYVKFLVSIPKQRMWAGLVRGGAPRILRRGQPTLYEDPETIINEVLKNNRAKPARFNGYTHLSLNLEGDIDAPYRHQKNVLEFVRKGETYLPENFEVSSRFIRYFKKIEALVAEREGHLLLTWPVSVRNPHFDLGKPVFQQRAAHFVRTLGESNIQIACHPAYFNLDYRLFFDTSYHLNTKGKRMRTKQLAECFQEKYADSKDTVAVSELEGFSWKRVLPTVRQQEIAALKGAF
ncbi:MAG: hypothetical protein C9356_03140 [Oleiphilus sp.]|nr:MAG: hypothetical protein C9356_03140 [Oleiphilus sp.]